MKTLTFDLETTSLDPWSGDIVCIGYSFDGADAQVAFDKIPKQVVDALADTRVLKIGHNLPFDIKWLRVKGVRVVGPYYDTRIAYLARHPFRDARLKTIMALMGHKPTDFKTLIDLHRPRVPKGLRRDERKLVSQEIAKLNWPDFVPREATATYCADDVNWTHKVYKKLGPVNDWVANVEFPLIDCIVDMEMRGIYLDKSKVEVIHEAFNREIKEIESQFPKYAQTKTKRACVLGSPKALREHLVDLGLSKELSKFLTHSGEYSTDKQAMTALANRVPVAQTILRYRALTKLVGTYTAKMRGMEIIRGTFNQVGTKTWRLSSSRPNLQQIPGRSDEGLQVRSCFTARPGHKLIVADLSQIEPRVYAWRSQDPVLLDVFQSGKDFHSTVAQAIYRRKDITKAERFIGKTVGLATLYGAGTRTIQSFLQKNKVHKTLAECGVIRNSIRVGFPKATQWSEDQWAKWDRFGKITTLGGRHIHKDSSYKVNPVNYSIQPTCADIMKLILLNLHNLGYSLLCTVHDEVMVEVPEHEVGKALAEVKDVMENSVHLPGMPLVTDIKAVDNWAEAK